MERKEQELREKAERAERLVKALLLTTPVVVLIAQGLSLWMAYVLTDLWRWFIMPTFQVAPVGVLPMWGMIVMAHLVFRREKSRRQCKEEAEEGFKGTIVQLLAWALYIAFAWGVAAVIHLGM